ncbi:MAG: sigma-70 family RNA polymerase sigma factor [Planctomycetes bacterium]|nr:sigma-70 family RNA polymerase sigma factor [Planctomycetota bacterium]
MVLAKLLSVVAKNKLQPAQRLDLGELDARLDVTTEAFSGVVERLLRQMAAAKATLDLEGYRTQRTIPADSAAMPELPDVRDSLYQQDLRRILPMDRAEEFRMARRHEFLSLLVRRQLERLGFSPEEAAERAKQPAHQTVQRLASVRPKRGIDLAWLSTMVGQLEELRRLYVEGALSIVLGTVNRYRGLGVDTADLIQEGNASLYQAIDGFDWRRDVRFRTYAQFWVHQAVLKMLYNSARTVRVPIWVQKILGKIRRAQDEGRRAGRELEPAEIAARIGVATEKVEWVLATRRYAVSIDAELAGGDGLTMAQTLTDDDQVSVPDSVPAGDLRASLTAAMSDLPEREQRILRRRFGLDGQEPQTLGEIATELGITAERVRQLQNAALGRMQRPAKLQQLQAFVE